MRLFESNLSEIEEKIFQNLKKNKAVFPEEVNQIENGLLLIRNLTKITKEASNQYPEKPNFSANHELFARNRELLLNAYVSLLFSSYGTQFVILRTVLENNNLMRLFNKKPQFAFNWLPLNRQQMFRKNVRSKFGKVGKHDETYSASDVRNYVFDSQEKLKVRKDIKKLYVQLCDYTHPNYAGWKELIIYKEKQEFLLNVPTFSLPSSESAFGLYLFMMQLTLKAFAETFEGYLVDFGLELKIWQDSNKKLLLRHQNG